MKKESMDKITKVLIGISAMMVMIGSFMKIMHFPNADSLLLWGFILLTVFNGIEISRLKKIIKGYEVEKVKNE